MLCCLKALGVNLEFSMYRSRGNMHPRSYLGGQRSNRIHLNMEDNSKNNNNNNYNNNNNNNTNNNCFLACITK